MNSNIVIKNIYYMLTYAFSVLRQTNYKEISAEDFDHIYDLLSKILYKAVVQQIKQGLYREYVCHNEDLLAIKGKINVTQTIKYRMSRKQKMNCEFDDLTVNNSYNQIIKSTILFLIQSDEVSKEQKLQFKSVLRYLQDVDQIQFKSINWSKLNYNKSNQSYKVIINICYFIIKSQLLSNEEGRKKVIGFTDDCLHRLYEKFILEYYRVHYPSLKPNSSKIAWDIDDERNLEFMPEMITDIHLTDGNKTLIIDAKFYGKSMQEKYGRKKFHSNNIYQIMAYVTHEDVEFKHNVKGMLLYAKTNESIVPDKKIIDRGYEYEFTTLDLNTDFHSISTKLNQIVEEYFK